jgi:hypothetical protein
MKMIVTCQRTAFTSTKEMEEKELIKQLPQRLLKRRTAAQNFF